MQPEEFREQPAPKVNNPQKARSIQKRGQEPMREALYRMSGVHLTAIDAIGVETVQVVLSEYGPDLSRFPTEKEFVSHVTLATRRPMSGAKPVRKKKRNTASTRVAAPLRMAALCAIAGRLWGPITAKSHGVWEETSRCSRRPGSWQS
jgi:hypothetical protein